MNSYIRVMFTILLILSSCSSSNLDDFEEEGEGIIRSMIQELQEIQTREELLASKAKLKRLFDRLVDTIISAESYLQTHPNIDKEGFPGQNHELSDQLRTELNRIYRMEAGRQIIEQCQETALHRLDAYEVTIHGAR